ncbi:MAG TPA: sugar transferase [bacterium]|nr:sugar transferase [bacterium]
MHSAEKHKISRGVHLFFDILYIAGAFFAAYEAKVRHLPEAYAAMYPLREYLWLLAVIVPLWLIIFKARGLYDARFTPARGALAIATSVAAGISLIIVILFACKVHYVSRIFIGLFGLFNVVIMMAGRGAVSLCAGIFLPKEYGIHRIVIAGDRKGIERAARLIGGHVPKGATVAGCVLVGRFEGSAPVEGVKYLGQVNELDRVIHEASPDEIVFVMDNEHLSVLKDAIYACEQQGITVRLLADFLDMRIARLSGGQFCGVPAITISALPQKVWQLFCKHILDFIGAFVLLWYCWLVFIVVPILIKLDSRGPIFFTQVRVGLRGRRFRIVKFRTMVNRAEDFKFGLSDLNEVQGPVFKMEQDPRVTRVGRWLRKYYIDEVPQLINVLLGEMSIVGPRPALPEEVEKYYPWQRRRLSMKPGITGSWQVAGVGIKEFDERVRIDLDYIDNWSLWNDFKIVLRTLMLIIKGKGV